MYPCHISCSMRAKKIIVTFLFSCFSLINCAHQYKHRYQNVPDYSWCRLLLLCSHTWTHPCPFIEHFTVHFTEHSIEPFSKGATSFKDHQRNPYGIFKAFQLELRFRANRRRCIHHPNNIVKHAFSERK